MGIRMLHRRKARARVHATAAADPRSWPGTAARARPRPAFAPDAATPRIPWAPGTALRAAAARLLDRARVTLLPGALSRVLSRVRSRVLPRFLPRFLAGSVRPGDSRRHLWGAALRGHLDLALGVLGRLRGPGTVRRARRIPVFVATTVPLTERPGDSAAH
ncbi:hypothetical protein OG440_28135 [Streptomyces sp. NBC_00637]|uniref:hypothetical protein n=1 Tax=Streptomyces sp. NBC_00637 TaxID=2903667 RepID=UPI003243B79B